MGLSPAGCQQGSSPDTIPRDAAQRNFLGSPKWPLSHKMSPCSSQQQGREIGACNPRPFQPDICLHSEADLTDGTCVWSQAHGVPRNSPAGRAAGHLSWEQPEMGTSLSEHCVGPDKKRVHSLPHRQALYKPKAAAWHSADTEPCPSSAPGR